MKLLILNPNMSVEMTTAMGRVASGVVAPDTELILATAPYGFPYISSRAEAQIAGVIALEMIAERQAEVDAVVIAAYGDPGLRAARELFDMPIIGMAESAMLTACMAGEKFSLVTFTKNLAPWYLESVTSAGLRSRLASIRIPNEDFRSVLNVQHELHAQLLAEVAVCVEEDQADVVILGGAPLAGMAHKVTDSPAVLIDPISAAVKQAEAMYQVTPRGANAGSMQRPPTKPNEGLNPTLGNWIARRTT
ncbi:MAG: aspartate/glutamate racemase family protein [Gammaproteobacteria bacterium]|nr:aspartate/glutamate racemase family protein [Gammaproteobacteria bacterium]